MGVDILTMSIAEVPEGRQRTPYLVGSALVEPREPILIFASRAGCWLR